MEICIIRHGEAEGLTAEERASRFPTRNYKNQESKESLIKREFEGLHTIQQNYHVKKVILVAHGAVINSILAVISNDEISSGKTKLANAGLSHILNVDGEWQIVSYNQTTHLNSEVANN